MLLFMDGQAHYDSSRIGMKYSTVDTTNATWAVTAEGRFGNCLKRTSTTNGGSGGYLGLSPLTTRLAPWVPTTGGICGFAIKIDDFSRLDASLSLGSQIFMVVEGAFWHLRVILNRDGTFSLCRLAGTLSGGSTNIIAQSSEGLTQATWMYLEFKWVIHDSAGLFQIHVNGVPVMTYAGQTIETEGSSVTLGLWNAVRLFTMASETPPYLVVRMCDLYLADLTSADPDDVSDFLGDGIIETIMPNAPGTTTGWTPSTAPNWDTVNDRPAPDDDGSYVVTTAPGTIDLYHFEDIPASAVVKGVHVNILARKETEGSSSVAPLVHQGGVNYLGTTQGVTSVVYDRYVTQAWDLNPATGAKFTAAEINAGQFGVQKML